MADTSIPIVAGDGSTRQIDTATQANGDHREVIALGDPGTTLVARVLDAAPVGTEAAQAVRQVGPAPAGLAVGLARTQVTPATVSTTAVVARTDRRGMSLYNASSGSVYVVFGATAATTAIADLVIASGGYYETPPTDWRITQEVRVIWAAAATDTLRVLEWV